MTGDSQTNKAHAGVMNAPGRPRRFSVCSCRQASGCIAYPAKAISAYGVEGRAVDGTSHKPLAALGLKVLTGGKELKAETSSDGKFAVPPRYTWYWTWTMCGPAMPPPLWQDVQVVADGYDPVEVQYDYRSPVAPAYAVIDKHIFLGDVRLDRPQPLASAPATQPAERAGQRKEVSYHDLLYEFDVAAYKSAKAEEEPAGSIAAPRDAEDIVLAESPGLSREDRVRAAVLVFLAKRERRFAWFEILYLSFVTDDKQAAPSDAVMAAVGIRGVKPYARGGRPILWVADPAWIDDDTAGVKAGVYRSGVGRAWRELHSALAR